MKTIFMKIGIVWCFMAVGFGHTAAQRTVADMLRPTCDSGQVVCSVIDTALVGEEKKTPLPSRHAASGQPVGNTLDFSKLTGDIPYQLSASATGQTELTLPIETFASDYEFSPGISLRYSSQSGMSTMGNGWALAGTSVITPTTSNFFTDGNARGKDKVNGPWMLDGIRLIRQAASDTVQAYFTQTGNAKVVRATDGIGGFVAFLPDGTTCRFDESDSQGRYWYLSSKTTLDGRKITYEREFGIRIFNYFIGNSSQDICKIARCFVTLYCKSEV